MVHGLSGPHFTHITIRYSDLSSFPCSSCQTRQEASERRYTLVASLFRLLREPHQWLRCPAILPHYFSLSTPKCEILDCGIRTPKALYGGHTPTRHRQINLLVKNLYRIKAHVLALRVGT